MVKTMKTQVLLRIQWKTQGQHRFCVEPMKNGREHLFCVGTNRKRTENTGLAWEHMENAQTIQVLIKNL